MDSRTKEVITTCTRDCPDTCGIVAEVREGRILRLTGARDHPVTRGFLCPKMYKYPRMLESSQRITTPLLRRGSAFVPLPFDEAYAMAAREVDRAVKKYGSRSILLFHSAGSLAVLNTLSQRFFNALGGATRNVGGLCLANAIRGQELDFGRGRLGNTPLDLANSGTIVFWGRNAADTAPHLFHQAREARKKKGARLVTVDPCLSRTARKSDLHIPVRPGGDWALALLLAGEILRQGAADPRFLKDNPEGREEFLKFLASFTREELLAEAGVPLSVLSKFMDTLLQAPPAAIYLGVGMTYWSRGVEAVRCINALGAVLGTLGQKGGGVNLSHPGWRHFNSSLTGDGRGERPVYEPNLAREILTLKDPPVKTAWVTGGNPLAQVPNSGLLREAFASLDFIIVNELFMTDTALQADLVLPVSSFLEREDLLGSWGHNYLGPVNPVLETNLPSDLEIFQMTARHLGLEGEMAGTPAEWLDRFLEPFHALGITWEKLRQGWLKNPYLPDIPPVDAHGFDIITNLPPKAQGKSPGEFTLLTPKPRHQTHSQKLPAPGRGPAPLFLSTGDAAWLGVEDGAPLEVTSSLGSLPALARIDAVIPAGVAVFFSGGWLCEGQGANLLTRDEITAAGGMTVNETRVRIKPRPA